MYIFTGGGALFPLHRKGSLLPSRTVVFSLAIPVLRCLNQRGRLGKGQLSIHLRDLEALGAVRYGMFLRKASLHFPFQSLNWLVLLYSTLPYHITVSSSLASSFFLS